MSTVTKRIRWNADLTGPAARKYAEQHEASLLGRRHDFAKRLSTDEFVGHKEITDTAMSLAYTEGVAYTLVRYADLRMDFDCGHDEAVDVLVSEVMNGADDTWSGRGNDGNRSYFDGRRETVSKMKRGW